LTEETKNEEYNEYFREKSETKSYTGQTTINEETTELFTGALDDIDDWVKLNELKIYQKDQDSERSLREKNATKAFNFSATWAVFVGVVIFIHGFNPGFLSEIEFLAVVGALTTSILVYYLHVIKYLFYRGVKKRNDN
tara:strand:+ start:10 stop:423 length:414 start_codon:yes stop_codon:yes gene_type:complete